MLIATHYATILKQTLVGWWQIKAPRLGAALAYYTILSLAPTIIIATPLIGLFFDRDRATGGIVDQFAALVGKEGAEAVRAILSNQQQFPPTRLTTYLGIGVLVF